MKTNPNDPINISFKELGESANPGLTKLEYFSGLAMQSLVGYENAGIEVQAQVAVQSAKALINALNSEEDLRSIKDKDVLVFSEDQDKTLAVTLNKSNLAQHGPLQDMDMSAVSLMMSVID